MSVRTPDGLNVPATVRAARAADLVPIQALAVDNALFAATTAPSRCSPQ